MRSTLFKKMRVAYLHFFLHGKNPLQFAVCCVISCLGLSVCMCVCALCVLACAVGCWFPLTAVSVNSYVAIYISVTILKKERRKESWNPVVYLFLCQPFIQFLIIHLVYDNFIYLFNYDFIHLFGCHISRENLDPFYNHTQRY